MDSLQAAPDGGCFLCGAHDTLVRLPAVEGPQIFRLCVDCAHLYGREMRRRPDRQRSAQRALGSQLGGPLSGFSEARAAFRAAQVGRFAMCLPPTIPCLSCEGSGGGICEACEGSKGDWTEKACGVCERVGEYPCPICKGRGRSFLRTCIPCRGSGRESCEVCHGTGTQRRFHPCRACQGSGRSCPRCSGTGTWELYKVTRGT